MKIAAQDFFPARLIEGLKEYDNLGNDFDWGSNSNIRRIRGEDSKFAQYTDLSNEAYRLSIDPLLKSGIEIDKDSKITVHDFLYMHEHIPNSLTRPVAVAGHALEIVNTFRFFVQEMINDLNMSGQNAKYDSDQKRRIASAQVKLEAGLKEFTTEYVKKIVADTNLPHTQAQQHAQKTAQQSSDSFQQMLEEERARLVANSRA